MVITHQIIFYWTVRQKIDTVLFAYKPKSPFQIVVLIEGKTRVRGNLASTASEYPLADFALFRSPARTVKIACWGAGLRWRPQSVKRFEALPEPTGETPDPYEKWRLPMANRKRNIQMKFYVTEEEKRLIDEKMAQLPTRRYGAYLRKMAIDGYIIQLDTTDIKQMNAALSAIGRNINQIAKRLNAGGSAYRADVEEIRERLDEIWQLQRRILSSQR